MSSKMSFRDGGIGDGLAMVCLGDEGFEERVSLVGRDDVGSMSQNASKADEGRGDSSCGLGVK